RAKHDAALAQVGDEVELKRWRHWLKRQELILEPEIELRSLRAWHWATGGLRWVSYPGEVGLAAYYRLLSQHKNMPRPDRCDSDLVNSISTEGHMIRHRDYLDPEQIPEIGRKVVGHDVSAQFLAAAGTVSLGDGEPEHYDNPRSLEGLTGLPGYVSLAEPLNTSHPAFQDIPESTWIPMPLVNYLVSRGVDVRASEVVVWYKHGRRLAKHAAIFRQAREKLLSRPEPVAKIALRAVKDVYANTYGGMLRSERYNHTGTMRRDWSDQLIALTWANAFRSLDRATYGFPTTAKDQEISAAIRAGQQPTNPPLGMCRDTAWHLTDTAPWTPPGLRLATEENRWQCGNWKLEKWADITEEMISAHEDLSPYAMRDAINAAHREREEVIP
ncbi:hypothetical protein, partial [Longimycelium tulufanense]|uniref:hypothetical protein n=1 Tax=Longimycelium tulufanense TaxID=907463 RepID=UPI001E2E7CE6